MEKEVVEEMVEKSPKRQQLDLWEYNRMEEY